MKSLMLWGTPPHGEVQPVGAVRTAGTAGLSASAYFLLVFLHLNKNIWSKDVKETMKQNEWAAFPDCRGAPSLFLYEWMEVGGVERIYNMHTIPNGRAHTHTRSHVTSVNTVT